MQEFHIINNYLKKLSKNNSFAKKLNDDVFFYDKKNLAISIDTYNEGIHFTSFDNPKKVIKKVIRSSISDLICKGVKPKFYFMSFSGYRNFLTKKKLKIIVKSLSEEQKKFNIKISGGDTVSSKTLSFTIVSLGFANQIIERNKTKIDDDIYVTGNIGDSYVGLRVIQKKINNIKKKYLKYFVNKYYEPDLPIKFISTLSKYASSSIDVSDGLISDLLKLQNNQKYHFKIFVDKIPISKNFNYFIKNKKLKKNEYLFNGDDYQILFTASKKNRKNIIKNSKLLNQKVSIIGKITGKSSKNLLIDKDKILKVSNYKGYSHKF